MQGFDARLKKLPEYSRKRVPKEATLALAFESLEILIRAETIADLENRFLYTLAKFRAAYMPIKRERVCISKYRRFKRAVARGHNPTIAFWKVVESFILGFQALQERARNYARLRPKWREALVGRGFVKDDSLKTGMRMARLTEMADFTLELSSIEKEER